MTPLRDRIIGALRLAPMTINEVSRCLSVHQETARKAVASLCQSGTVRRRTGIKRRHCGATAFRFEIAA